jgi:acylphosphatase
MVRAHIYFKGTVQGVGFRYTCRSYAEALGLKGWVKNLADGRVEALVEGPKPDTELLIEKLKEHFGGYIHDVHADHSDALGEFTDFKIVF